jgi:transposase
MRDELGTFYTDADFADLFSKRGQPAFSPWRLALITVMQFAEGLSDRQAAEAVRARIDWKYALSLELTDTGFDFSILSEFRSRLVQKGEESKLLEKMLDCFREKQLLKARGKQRTDSTHILASVRYLSRLESVAETLRATLNEIAKTDPEWLLEQVSDEWFERYSRRIEDYRLPKSREARNKYAETVGADGFRLLQRIDKSRKKSLKELPMVSLLRQQWEHQFQINDASVQLIPAKELKPSGERFESPYDPESHFATKRTNGWRGYKVHFTEVCDDDSPHLITNVLTTSAVIPDTSVGKEIHDSLKNKKLLPNTHLVDLRVSEILCK